MDPQHRAQLGQDLWVAEPTGKNSRGQLTYGVAVSVPSRQEVIRTRTPDSNGGVIFSEQTLITVEASTTKNSRIWLDGEDPLTDEPRRVDSWFPVPDENGNINHYETFV